MNRLMLAVLIAFTFVATGSITRQPSTSWPKPPRKTLDLQSIIDKAQDGSTITIPFGEYRFPKGLEIRNRKNLILTSQPGTRILVEDTNSHVLSIQQSEGVGIRNLYLRHVKPLKEYECHGAVIRVDDSKSVTILNCELNGCGAIGVAAFAARSVVIQNCFVHHNTFNAFYFESCGGVKIESSIVRDNGNFIQMYRTESLEMRDNILRRNGGYWNDSPDPNPGLQKEPSDS